jgi:hypothetical protein
MKKAIKYFLAILMFITTIGLSETFSQKLVFFDSLANNKMVGQANVFNIDNQSRVVTMLLYNGDVPFPTTKLVFQFFELTNDTVEKFVTRQIIDVPANSRSYMRKLPFSSPNRLKVKALTYEGKLLADEKLTITAQKQPIGNAGFAAVLNEIISFYPSDFKNITGYKIGDNFMFPTWHANENLPGYDFATINAEASLSRKYWATTIIETKDSTEALNKYNEISNAISQVKFDCCVFNKEEEYNYNDPKYPNRKTTIWFPSSVNTGKDKEYARMPLELMFRYPLASSKEYTVNLNIGFTSAADEMLYTLRHLNH